MEVVQVQWLLCVSEAVVVLCCCWYWRGVKVQKWCQTLNCAFQWDTLLLSIVGGCYSICRSRDIGFLMLWELVKFNCLEAHGTLKV